MHLFMYMRIHTCKYLHVEEGIITSVLIAAPAAAGTPWRPLKESQQNAGEILLGTGH